MISYDTWLALVALVLTFLLWGVDKILDVADVATANSPEWRRVIFWAKVAGGGLFIGAGIYLLFLVNGAGPVVH